jgi:hypothetical protein
MTVLGILVKWETALERHQWNKSVKNSAAHEYVPAWSGYFKETTIYRYYLFRFIALLYIDMIIYTLPDFRLPPMCK